MNREKMYKDFMEVGFNKSKVILLEGIYGHISNFAIIQGCSEYVDSFLYEDITITNPFLDTSGRDEVNPIEEYGVSITKLPLMKKVLAMDINENMDNKELNLIGAKILGELQSDLYEEVGTQDDMVSFDSEGQDIINPFMSEDFIVEVDPIEYYGDNFKNSDFMKFFK